MNRGGDISQCPMHQDIADKPTPKPTSETAQCPMKGELNPANNIPFLANEATSNQLPLEREISKIPRKDGDNINRWEYPSPQQFYNALLRKGKETPVEHVEMMVDIHNFLNEGAWDEILKWEKLHSCHGCDKRSDPLLLKFSGKPDQLTPKAWFYSTFFGAPKPFDRHDWIVDRCGVQKRYIIDYYSDGQEDTEQVATFNLDVRPALDSLQAVKDRFAVVISDFFNRWS